MNEVILNISIFCDITKISFTDNAIKQNPNLYFTTIKDNFKYTTLKEFKKEEQLNIDEYSSPNSQNGLNCVRAHRCPELICDCNKGPDRRLIETNPINRVLRLHISKNKLKLYHDNKVPIIPLQYSKEAKHSLNANKVNLIINEIRSE